MRIRIINCCQNVRDKKGDHGYDARNDEYVTMFDAGIIDPQKLPRSC